MSLDLKTDQILDCKGLKCPMPILKTKIALGKLRVGQVLEMVATDKGSKPDMAAFIEQTGHELVSMSEKDGVFVYYVRKTKE